ncbi:MAG: glycosyltransferase family 2 protein [Ahrensia sp.]|nr:glycosyltransferase family 2 protein [Ahrensia sp.]
MSRVYPRLSMVVPAFKAGDTIKRTLDSVIAQDYSNLQLIVIDGGSKDQTVDILKDYDEQIAYWVSEPDKGQVDALEKGFKQADGELYGWICADDEFMPDSLKRLVDVFLDFPDTDVATGGCRRIFPGDEVVDTSPDPRYLEDLTIKNTIEQPSTLWRAYLAKNVGPLDGSYKYAFDWEYWCRFKKAGAVFRSIPDPISIYHFSGENLTSSGGRKIADEMYRIVKEYGPYNGRVANVYRFLYRWFDLHGYYDADLLEKKPGWKRSLYFAVLRMLYRRYDPHTINSYNWNFVSRQERGRGW